MKFFFLNTIYEVKLKVYEVKLKGRKGILTDGVIEVYVSRYPSVLTSHLLVGTCGLEAPPSNVLRLHAHLVPHL